MENSNTLTSLESLNTTGIVSSNGNINYDASWGDSVTVMLISASWQPEPGSSGFRQSGKGRTIAPGTEPTPANGLSRPESIRNLTRRFNALLKSEGNRRRLLTQMEDPVNCRIGTYRW